MMLYLTIIRAAEYLIILDTNITPYQSTKKFENARYRLLHDRLVEFFNKLQAQQMYHTVTEIMHSYINKQQKSKGVDPTVDEIKLLLVTDITKKFKIGDFHIGMLDLAKEYDDRLLSHWISLAQYTMDQLKKSVNQEIENYQFSDIAINKSVSFIWFLSAELLYEIVILQMDLNKWAWRKGSAFDHQVYELIPRIHIDYDFIIKKDGCIYTELHFDPINLFTIKPNIIDAYVLFRRNHELPMDILVVYGYYEIQDVCRRSDDLNNPSTDKPVGNIEMLKHTFLVDKNMYKIQVVACSLFANGYINDADANMCLSLPPIYLLFARQELVLSACYKIEEWRESHLLADEEFGLISKLINYWLQLKYAEV